MSETTRLHILGPFQVESAEGGAAAVSGRARVVLAALAVWANRSVSAQTLAEYAWEDELPRSVRPSLQTVVARLRRSLPAGLIETTAQGYLLRASAESVDLLEFRELVEAAARSREAGDVTAELDHLGRAIALWRGEALADVRSARLVHEIAPGLREEWFRALERSLDIQLADGRHRAILADLRELTTRFPLREALWQRLIVALHRAGRRAEALEAYATAAAAARDQLGLDPGKELVDLQQAVLRDDKTLIAGQVDPTDERSASARAAPTSPRQLPAVSTALIGRQHELAALDTLAADLPEGVGHARIGVVDGGAGCGKSALAVHWAHRVAADFHAGQLYLNLHGYGPGRPVEPADALEEMLRALNTPAARIPADLDARSALLRSELAGRRLLVILDNARDSEQVRPLLPPAGCVTVITSRRQLHGLVVREGARRVPVERLTEDEAARVLADAAGCRRLDAEPRAITELVELCARLPLALRIIGERMAFRPDLSPARFVAELIQARRRLDVLDVGEDLSSDLRAVFSWSYEALNPAQAAAFRLLGRNPGQDITVPAAAALLGVSSTVARRALQSLVSMSLLEQRQSGRYVFHDLLREFAAERADQDEPAAGSRAARERLIDWYLHTADRARRRLGLLRRSVPITVPVTGVQPLEFLDARQAESWLRAERAGLVAACRLAAVEGFHDYAWKLPCVLWEYLYLNNHLADVIATLTSGLAAARARANPVASTYCINGLVSGHLAAGRVDRALALGEEALAACRESGDETSVAAAHGNLALVYATLDRHEESIEHGELAVSCATADLARAAALNNLASAYTAAGRAAEAVPLAREAVEIFAVKSDRRRECMAMHSLGAALAATGNDRGAADTHRAAAALAAAAGNARNEALNLADLGRALSRLGLAVEAAEALARSERLFAELGMSMTAGVRIDPRHRPIGGNRLGAVGTTSISG